MKQHGKVESNERPEPIVVDEHSVWVSENIEESQRETEEGQETIFTFDLAQYTKDEYILDTMGTNKTTSDLAIAELAEIVLGGMS